MKRHSGYAIPVIINGAFCGENCDSFSSKLVLCNSLFLYDERGEIRCKRLREFVYVKWVLNFNLIRFQIFDRTDTIFRKKHEKISLLVNSSYSLTAVKTSLIQVSEKLEPPQRFTLRETELTEMTEILFITTQFKIVKK